MKKANSPNNSLLLSISSRISSNCIGKGSKQAGIAAVEFTLLLPLMLLFVAAIGEFGNILIKYNTLSKAVQNGARIAVTEVYGTGNPSSIASKTDISNAVIYGSINPTASALPVLQGLKVDVRKDPKKDADGNDMMDSDENIIFEPTIIVTVTYPYQALMAPLLDNIISQNFELTSSSVMRVSP